MSPSAMPARQNKDRCRQVPPLPRETKIDVAKCHACHVKRRWMLPSATPATQECRAATANQQTAPSPISATPATQDVDRCRQVPCRKSAAAPRATNGAQARQQTLPSVMSATPATQNEDRCRQVPRWPRETKVDVAKCHAWISPATQKCRSATGNQRRPSAPPDPAQSHECHAGRVKRRWRCEDGCERSYVKDGV